jgi:hypothetical protein
VLWYSSFVLEHADGSLHVDFDALIRLVVSFEWGPEGRFPFTITPLQLDRVFGCPCRREPALAIFEIARIRHRKVSIRTHRRGDPILVGKRVRNGQFPLFGIHLETSIVDRVSHTDISGGLAKIIFRVDGQGSTESINILGHLDLGHNNSIGRGICSTRNIGRDERRMCKNWQVSCLGIRD